MSSRRRKHSPSNNPQGEHLNDNQGDKKLDDNEEYEVEAILGAKRFNGVGMYRIKWLGYGHEHNSWEPVENLTNCQKKLDAFQKEKRRKRVERGASTSASPSPSSEPVSPALGASHPAPSQSRIEYVSASSYRSTPTSTSRRSPSKPLSTPLSKRLGPQNTTTMSTSGKRYMWPEESHSETPTKRPRIERNAESKERKLETKRPSKRHNNDNGRKLPLDTQEKFDQSFEKILEQTNQVKGNAEQAMANAEDINLMLHSSTLFPITPTSNDFSELANPIPAPLEPSLLSTNNPAMESISTSSVSQTSVSEPSKPIADFQSRTSMSTLEGPSPNFPNIASILNTVQRAASNAVPLALIASKKDLHESVSNGPGTLPDNQTTAASSSLAANVSLPTTAISNIRERWSKIRALPSVVQGSDLIQPYGKRVLKMRDGSKNLKNGAFKLDPWEDLKSDALSGFAMRNMPGSPESRCTIDGNPVWWLGPIYKHGEDNLHFAHVGLVPIELTQGDGKYRRHLRTAEALCVRYVIPADRAFKHVTMSRGEGEMLPLAVYATVPGPTGVVETNSELHNWAKWLASKNLVGIVPLASATLFIFSSNYPALRSSVERATRNPALIVALCKKGKVPVEPSYARSDHFVEPKYIPPKEISNMCSLRFEFLARYFGLPESFSSTICDKSVAIYSLDPGYNQEVEDMISLVKRFKGNPLLCTCKNGIWKEGKLAFNRGEISHVLAHRNTRKVINDLPGISQMRERGLPGDQVTFAYFGSDVAAGEFDYTEFYHAGGYAIPTARFLIENPGFITNFCNFAEMEDMQRHAAWHLSIHPDVVQTLKSMTITTSDTIISPDELVLALLSFSHKKPKFARKLDPMRHELVCNSESGQELLPGLLLTAARLHLLYHKCVRHFVVLVSDDERAQYYGNNYKGASIMTERTLRNVFGMVDVHAE